MTSITNRTTFNIQLFILLFNLNVEGKINDYIYYIKSENEKKIRISFSQIKNKL